VKISWILPNSLAIAAKYILQHSLKNISKVCGDRYQPYQVAVQSTAT